MASGEFPILDLVIAEHGALSLVLTLKDQDGTVVDVTGYTFWASVKASRDDTATELVDISPAVLVGASGTVQFDKPASDFAALSTDTEYVWDCYFAVSGDTQDDADLLCLGAFSKVATATNPA